MAGSPAHRLSRRRLLGGFASICAVGSAGGLMVEQARAGRASSRPAIVSHRGAAGLAPPNTVAGIQRALELEVDGIELDVRQTKDGTLVLFHDPVLDWATDGHGRVEETRWEDIASARIGGEPIPRLTDALAVLADANVELFLEAKRVGYTAAILDRVEEYGLRDALRLISPKPDALTPAREAGLPVGLVGVAPNPELLKTATAIGATSVSTHYVPSAYPWFVKAAHENGLRAGIWHLLETRESLAAASSAGPDFITTNRPDLAVGLGHE